MLKDQTIGAVNTGKGENQHDDPMDLREQSCFMFQFSSVINLVFSVPLPNLQTLVSVSRYYLLSNFDVPG